LRFVGLRGQTVTLALLHVVVVWGVRGLGWVTCPAGIVYVRRAVYVLCVRTAERRRGRIGPEQERCRAEVDARNARIQEVGVRPVDGVTFGKLPKARKGD
jgi:hypothetical protein